MKAEELRIGNLVYVATAWSIPDKTPLIFGDMPHEIDAINFKDVSVHDFPDFRGTSDIPIADLKPIPLTEEWAKKFKLEKIVDYLYSVPSNNGFNIQFYEYSHNVRFYLYRNSIIESYVDLLYVHQLQNLYFALTGEELSR